MINQKLQQIGKKLNITGKDIRNIRKAAVTNKILYWIIGAIVAVIAFVVGFFAGRETCPSEGGGYPYAAGLIIPSMLATKKKSSKVAILLISVIVFLIALKANPVFGQAIKYNVYKR